MARNPKQDANLKPYKKGDITSEEAKKRGRAGGVKSGESRRAKRDAKSAVRYLLDLAAKGKIADNLKELGFPANEQTNMAALQARLFTMAMGGNIDAYTTLMRMAGYDRRRTARSARALRPTGAGKSNWMPRSLPWVQTRRAERIGEHER